MSTFYEDNMNIKKINGFTLQQVSRDVWAIDEFGIDIMYLIIGTERALLIDTGIRKYTVSSRNNDSSAL